MRMPSNADTKAKKFSFQAGYRAGYNGSENKHKQRHEDLWPFYNLGYEQGQKDKAKRF